jgi:hypothetical protein
LIFKSKDKSVEIDSFCFDIPSIAGIKQIPKNKNITVKAIPFLYQLIIFYSPEKFVIVSYRAIYYKFN